MLQQCRDAVVAIGRGKRVVVVDGVGYPAVGSIVGVSNGHVAAALNAPVVLVGKRGVGDAVDSFNLNAAFFETHGVTVIGSIFNRLPVDGYYSLENCKEAVSAYFAQHRTNAHAYGFLPEIDALKNASPAPKAPSTTGGGEGKSDDAAAAEAAAAAAAAVFTEAEQGIVDILTSAFLEHVDLDLIIADAAKSLNDPAAAAVGSGTSQRRPLPVSRMSAASSAPKRSREEIQSAARGAGAGGG